MNQSLCFQEETLMFSSLNAMENAEYTFHTAFQDHQYKAGSHSIRSSRIQSNSKVN